MLEKLFPARIVSVKFVAELECDALEHIERGILCGFYPHGKWILRRVDDRHFIAERKHISKRKNSVMKIGKTVHQVNP